MQYQETTETLDNIDRRIFYRKLLQNQVIVYAVGLLGGFFLFFDLNLGDLNSEYAFIMCITFSLLFFIFSFSSFKTVLKENQKKLITGMVKRKTIGKSVATSHNLGYWLHFDNQSLEIEASVYHYISPRDYIILHCHKEQGSLRVFRYETSKRQFYVP